MMKSVISLAGAVALIVAFALPAGALSLNESILTTSNGYHNKKPFGLEHGLGKSMLPPIDAPAPEGHLRAGEILPQAALAIDEIILEDADSKEEPELASNSGPMPVPEPATLVLLGSGLIGLTCLTRRRKRPNR